MKCMVNKMGGLGNVQSMKWALDELRGQLIGWYIKLIVLEMSGQ